jgi:hypothetical protein
MNNLNQIVLDENNIAFHPMMGNSYQLNDTAKEIIINLTIMSKWEDTMKL